MPQPSLLRRALEQVREHAGHDAFQRIAARYDAQEAETPEQMADGIVAGADDDLDQVVLETGAWGLPIWQIVIQKLGGPMPESAEQAIGTLERLLGGAPRTVKATDTQQDVTRIDAPCLDEDDEEPTGYPAREDLSTDAVLPWTRTKLTNFQRRAAKAAFEALFRDGKGSTLLCLPEAGGRTRTAADVVLGACTARKLRAIWVCPSRVLLDQVQEEIRELGWLVGELGSRPSVFSVSRVGSQHCDVSGDIVLLSPGALFRNNLGLEDIEQHGPISLVCIDDAFMVADPRVRAVLDAILRPHVRLLGLTGTPLQASETASTAVTSLFTHGQAFQLTFRDLVEAQHLARPVFIRKKLGSTNLLPMSEADLHWALQGRKDFSGELLRVMVQQDDRCREILGHWVDHRGRYGPTIVFAYDRHHAEVMSHWLNNRDVPNDPVHPGMPPATRRQRLDRFRSKKSEVLVLAGLLTEGEQLDHVQSVVLARPTLSALLYKHMVGHGARRADPKKGKKSLFYVVDCIDDLEDFGVSLAGRSAAVDLDTDFEDTTTTLVVPTEVERHHLRRNRALVSTRAWQILRRFADDQYSVWGELNWPRPGGGDKSVIVFHEGIARLRTVVDLVESALLKGDLVPLREMGKELDWLGAVRNTDWQEMLSDCAETGEVPTLRKADGNTIPPTVEACARIIAQLVEEMLAGRMTIHAALEHCDSLLADSEPLQDQFNRVEELREEMLALYRDAVSRVEFAPVPGTGDRSDMITAFVRFTVGVAMADRTLHDAESRAIVKAVARMFDLTTPEQHQWVTDAVNAYRDEPFDLQETASTLRAQATRAELYHMYDWLFRVAFADGVFVAEERALLRSAAGAMGIALEEVEELEARYAATLPQESVPPPAPGPPLSLLPMPLIRYCTQCGYPRQLEADFCVSCGSELPRLLFPR